MLLSHRAMRFAKTLPSPLRSLGSPLRSSVHPSRFFVIQRFTFDFNSSYKGKCFQVLGIRASSSSREPQNAQEDNVPINRQPRVHLDEDLVYKAPMSRAVRLMKAVSVTSCTLTSIGMPVLCILSAQDTSTIGKWAMCGTITLFGLGTTSLFHFLFKPYVMRMWLTNASRATVSAGVDSNIDSTVTVETLTLFAQLERHSFRLSDVSPPTQAMHPMVSFQARGRHYFIHPETFDDLNLLNKLVGSRKH